jgi:hypothetical protein
VLCGVAMPSSHAPRIWTPRMTKRWHGRQLTFHPKISEPYSPPKPPTMPQVVGSPTLRGAKDEDAILVRAERWSEEADRLDERGAAIRLELGAPPSVVEQHGGDGEDEAASPSLVVKTDKELAIDQQAARLRARAAAAKEAVAANRGIAALEVELSALTEAIDSRLDVQLGATLVRRGIKAGEIIGSWPKSQRVRMEQQKKEVQEGATAQARAAARARVARAVEREVRSWTPQLLRIDFVDAVVKLDLMQSGQPAQRHAIGVLFDSIDTDSSGTLDMKEAVAALRKWQGYAKEAAAEKDAKERELRRLKALVSKKLTLALRQPSSSRSPTSPFLPSEVLPPPREGSAPPSSAAPPSRRLLHRLIGRGDGRDSHGPFGAPAAAPSAASSRRVLEQAIQRLRRTQLSRGMGAWVEFTEVAAWRDASLRRAVMHVRAGGKAGGRASAAFHTWMYAYRELLWLARTLHTVALHVHRWQLARALRSWRDGALGGGGAQPGQQGHSRFTSVVSMGQGGYLGDNAAGGGRTSGVGDGLLCCASAAGLAAAPFLSCAEFLDALLVVLR